MHLITLVPVSPSPSASYNSTLVLSLSTQYLHLSHRLKTRIGRRLIIIPELPFSQLLTNFYKHTWLMPPNILGFFINKLYEQNTLITTNEEENNDYIMLIY